MLVLTMVACGNASEKPEVSVFDSETASALGETQPKEATAPTEPVVLTEFDDYFFIHTEQRDLDWEEDIVYLAKMYLGEGLVKGHPKLVNKWFTVYDKENRVTTRYFYDVALRDHFIAEIYKLIEDIPELTDSQIVFEMQRIVALLGDAHSTVNIPMGASFPFEVEQMESNGELGLYVTKIITQHDDLLYAELLEINGYSIDEVRALLGRFVSAENKYHVDMTIFHKQMILDCSALQAAGIVGAEEDIAVFQFRTANGEIVEILLRAAEDTSEADYVKRTQRIPEMLSMSKHGSCNYFGTYLSDDGAYYIRLYIMHSESEYRLQQFLWDCDKKIKQIGSVDKLVIDIRMNPGGYQGFIFEMLDYLKESDFEQIYILTDGATSSASVWFSFFAQEEIETAIFVGTPTGQPPNFFAGSANMYELKNHDYRFTISVSYSEIEEYFEGTAVLPDVLVYQNLHDYIKGIDTQLEAALNMERIA